MLRKNFPGALDVQDVQCAWLEIDLTYIVFALLTSPPLYLVFTGL